MGKWSLSQSWLLHLWLWHCTKGEIKPKADWRAVDFSKKRTNNFVLFALLFGFSQQTKQIRLFVFWENLWRANPAFGFI